MSTIELTRRDFSGCGALLACLQPLPDCRGSASASQHLPAFLSRAREQAVEGVDWNNHVGAKHHFDGARYGDIHRTEPAHYFFEELRKI